MILQISDNYRIIPSETSWDVEKKQNGRWIKLFYCERLSNAFRELTLLEIKLIPGSNLQEIKEKIVEIEDRTFDTLDTAQKTM